MPPIVNDNVNGVRLDNLLFDVVELPQKGIVATIIGKNISLKQMAFITFSAYSLPLSQ